MKFFKTAFFILVIISIFSLSSCKYFQNSDEQDQAIVINETWKEITLTDVNTNQEFKISDFKGTPVLIESFAVWCSTCKKQQDITKELHEELGDSVISISLDTDPNEDIETVKAHTTEHGYHWRYAISPVEMTNALIDQYGISVVNAPLAPIILICEDQSTRFLDSGLKSVDDLKQAINLGC